MPQYLFLRKQAPTYTSQTGVMENPKDYKHKTEKENKSKRLLKRIGLHQLMDLKVDYAFKQLFGNEKNKDITIVFLNAILQKTGRNPIRDISFLNIEAGGEYIEDKQSRLDLLVTTEDGERVNVEIQFTNQYDMIKRSIYYWSGAYRNPLQKKMSYKELKPVIAINIMNFDLFKQTQRFHTSYHLYEDGEKFQLTDVMELHFIEMPKLIKAWKEEKLDPWNNLLARWLLLLGMVDHRKKKIYEEIFRELEGIAMKDKTLRNAFQNWEELSMTQEQYLAYESRLKRINDEEAAQREAELRLQEATEKAVKDGREQGRKQGRKEGRKEGRIEGVKKEKEAIARRLLLKGIAIEEVMEFTELNENEVIEIKNNL